MRASGNAPPCNSFNANDGGALPFELPRPFWGKRCGD